MTDFLSVYVSCAGSGEIVRYALDAHTGTLAFEGRTHVPGRLEGMPQSMPLAVSADQRFLYAATRTPPFTLASFAIDPADGTLAPIGTALAPASLAYIATDRTNRVLIGASYPGSMVVALPIDADGRATEASTQTFADVPKAHSVLVDPSNAFALAAALGADRVFRYDIDAASGRIAAAVPASVAARDGAGARHLALNPRQPCLYVINETDGTIDTYALRRDPFALALRQSVDMRPPGAAPIPNARAADLHVTPDGRFLYGSERELSTIAAFAIDAGDGTLTRIGSYASQPGTRGFAIDPAGRFLVAAGQVSGGVSVHAIDPKRGVLTEIGACDAGPGANWVEIVGRNRGSG